MEGVGGEYGAVEIETSRELGRKVLGVGGAAPVAAEIDASAVAETVGDDFHGIAHGRLQGAVAAERRDGFQVGVKALFYQICTVHVVSPSLQNSKS